MSKTKTIVVEDQPIVWDYIRSTIDEICEIQAFCTTTKEAEKAIKEYKPELIWLDCYLGEFSDSGQGIKNSGLQIAQWVKSHHPEIKIFLFTASNEPLILKQCENLGIEGIALSGKYINDKEVVKQGVEAVIAGNKWLSPQVIESYELEDLNRITVFEFSVLSALICGKNTSTIAEELSTTRKRVNNAVYRAQQKLFIDPELSREDFLDMFKDKIMSSLDRSKYYSLTEVVSVNSLIQNCLNPVIEELGEGNLAKKRIKVSSL
jgi:DNA-binding NarL/FixJ family response regulator